MVLSETSGKRGWWSWSVSESRPAEGGVRQRGHGGEMWSHRELAQSDEHRGGMN